MGLFNSILEKLGFGHQADDAAAPAVPAAEPAPAASAASAPSRSTAA